MLQKEVHYKCHPLTPLDAQFGVFPAKTVPAEMHDLVFGAPKDDEAPRSYAVLDAAKIPNFPERLEAEGLRHKCLILGKMGEDLGVVGPWLVELDANGRLCRDMFTMGDGPWDMHGREAYVILQSSLPFDDIHRHLRKFTKLRDANGQWHFFRFFEPLVMRTIVMGLPEDARETFLAPFVRVLAPDQGERMHVFEPETSP